MSTVATAIVGGVVCVLLFRTARSASIYARVPHHRFGPGSNLRPPSRLDSALRSAHVGLSARDTLLVWGGSAIAVAALASRIAMVLVVPALTVVVAAGPMLLRFARRNHRRQVAAALVEMLERVAGVLRSGGTVVGALHEIAHSASPLARDAELLVHRLRLGADLDDALERWCHERDIAGLEAVAGALATAHELGGPSAAALDRLATSMRTTAAVRAEARSLSTQARMSAWIVGTGPAVYVLVSAVVSPESASVLVDHPVGRVCLVAGCGLLGLAAIVLRRMIAEPV